MIQKWKVYKEKFPEETKEILLKNRDEIFR